MFKKIEPLEHSKHQDLRLSKISDFGFAAQVSTVTLSFSELRQASRYFPIVFFKDAPCLPQAMLSLENGKNAFVDGAGNWKVPYIPIFLRLYPFIVAKIQGQEDKNVLCLDPEAAHFKSAMGDPLFTTNGEAVEFIQKNVLGSQKVYQDELKKTEILFKSLDEKGLIVDRVFKYKVVQEEKSINGFMGVDMDKLKTLDDKYLADLVRNGTMGMIHEHIGSLINFPNLLTPAVE